MKRVKHLPGMVNVKIAMTRIEKDGQNTSPTETETAKVLAAKLAVIGCSTPPQVMLTALKKTASTNENEPVMGFDTANESFENT